MKQGIFTVRENRPLTASVYEMLLAGDASAITAPDQFVNIQLDGLYLRRPISVCDWEKDTLKLIYKVVGVGTDQMSRLKNGDTLDCLTGLGNGYDTALCGANPLLIGGGVGVPPLYGLARRLIKEGRQVAVILGFNTKDEIFYEDAFRRLGCDVAVTTADGSYGVRGFVTDAMQAEDRRCVFACGPLPMLRAVYRKSACPTGQYSLEERMGCGFGACMGCSIRTRFGPKRVCKDGPVFKKEELLWDD